MSKAREILEGWGNLIFRPEHNNPIVEARLLKCDDCKIRTGVFCDKNKGGCGCVIPAKVRSMDSKCPVNKW